MRNVNVFADERGFDNTVTSENLKGFIALSQKVVAENAQNTEENLRVLPRKIADDVVLADFYPQNASEAYKNYMNEVLISVLAQNCSEKHREQLIGDMADKNPQLVAGLFRRAGNSQGGSYSFLIKGLQENKLVDNLKFYDAMVKNNCRDLYFDGKQEPVSHLGDEQKNILAGWMRDVEFKNEQADDAAYFIKELVNSGILLNCDNLPETLREKVNVYALADSHGKAGWLSLEGRFMDKAFLKALLQSNTLSTPKKEMPAANAKTQKQKNVGILPAYYKAVCAALVKEAENMPKYDPENYGKELGLNQRYVALVKELKGQNYKIEQDQNSVLFDVFVQTAEKDISAGRAADLDAPALQSVLARDKDNFYLRKISVQVLEDKKIKLDADKSEIVGIGRLDNLAERDLAVYGQTVAKSTKLNRAEKEAVAAFLAEKMTSYAQKTDAHKKLQAEKQQDDAELTQLNVKLNNARDAQRVIEKVQEYYGKLQASFKDGKPNSQESAVLNAQQIEKAVAEVAAGKYAQIALPEQKGLPLLLGRKEEQARRENLNKNIADFNGFLSEISVKQSRQENAELKQYLGKMLDKNSLMESEDRSKDLAKEVKDLSAELKAKWGNRDFNAEVADNEKVLAAMQKAKDSIQKRKEDIKKMAKENMAVGDEKLEDVSSLTGKEKHDARAANKAKGKDKLAEGNLAKLRADKLKESR